MPTPFRRRLGVLACVSALAAAGCTTPAPGEPEPSSPAEPTAGPTFEDEPAELLAEPSPAPAVGECRALTATDIGAPRDDTEPVGCGTPHSAQTLHVGRIPRRVLGDPERPDARAIADYVTPRCDRRFARSIGGDLETRILSRLHSVWFLPSHKDLALGARWFRCAPSLSAPVMSRRGCRATSTVCSPRQLPWTSSGSAARAHPSVPVRCG